VIGIERWFLVDLRMYSRKKAAYHRDDKPEDPGEWSRSERAREASKETEVIRRIRKRNLLHQEVASKSTPSLRSSASFQSHAPRFRGVDSVNDLFWRPSCQN
jgi:hypothetical protein